MVQTSILARAQHTFALNAFEKALSELGTESTRKLRRDIHKDFTDYKEVESTYDEGDETIEIWIKIGEEVSADPIKISIEKLEKEINYNDNLRKFEEISVRVDRIGFMLYNLGVPEKLKQSYLNWLSVMFCEIWNKLAPHILLRRMERFKRYRKTPDDVPLPKLFVPYFEKMVYESYEYYKRLGEKATIFCFNKESRVEI